MIHVAVISHGHEDLLIQSALCGLLNASPEITLWIKDNKPAVALKSYCEQHQVFYTDADAGLGFGENNNYLFNLIQSTSGFQTNDLFLVMNPDVIATPETILAFAKKMQASSHAIAALNLQRDHAMTTPDHNIRHFPGILSIIKMPLTNTFSETYDKASFPTTIDAIPVEWASGAFLGFTPALYQALGGFDQSYFMYFEDVDICYRARRYHQQTVQYYPALKAVHAAARKNRNIFSQHAIWFFHSFAKFLWRRYLRRSATHSGIKPNSQSNF